MKQFNNRTIDEKGFTLIELMIVVAIMGIMVGVFSINLSGQRATRNIRIAQSELVTNIRKAQSYTLFSRKTDNNQTPYYYILKFEMSPSGADGYLIQALYKDAAGNWKTTDVERINLPAGIRFAASHPLTFERPTGINPTLQDTSTCGLVAFRVPFAKIYLDYECDYQDIQDFVTNVAGYPASEDSKLTIRLTDAQNTMVKTVMINGVTGLITFN